MRFLLPYDGSAVARAALRHFTDPAHRRLTTGSLILVLASGRRCAIDRRLAEARRLVGPDVPLSFRLLGPDGLHAGLQRLADTVPESTFAAVLDLRGTTAWYQAVAGSLLTGRYGTCVAVDRLPRVAPLRLPARAQIPAATTRWRRHGYACRGAGSALYRRAAPRRLNGSHDGNRDA
jgi:hypothetical protein